MVADDNREDASFIAWIYLADEYNSWVDAIIT